MSTDRADDRLTIPQAAALLGVTPDTVRRYIAAGYLHAEQGRPALQRTQLLLMRAEVAGFTQEHVARAGVTRARRAEEAMAQNMEGSLQVAPDDLVPVAEAAQAVGVTRYTLYAWIRRGFLPAQGGPRTRRVSLSAVRAVLVSPDPHAPADALPVWQVVRETGMSGPRIHAWAKQGLVPSWRGRHGKVVRVADVQAVAEMRSKGETGGQEQELRGVRG